MRVLSLLFITDFHRRSKDGFVIGYNIIFPVVMILLLGYLASRSYGNGFTGYQYYSIVMVPFCVAMSMITAAYAGKDDAYKKTAVRFLFAPVSEGQIVLSKLLSCSLIISLCNLIVLLFAMLVLKLPIAGNRFFEVFLLLTSETYAVCAIGLYIGFGMKNFILIKNVMNIPICAAAVLGGAFYPIGSLNPRVEFLLQLSPLTWVNRSLFRCIYDNESALLWRTSIALAAAGIGFTLLAVKLFKKEEFIHGDLPGYEK